MNAREYLKKYNRSQSLVHLLESYHTQRSKEEAEERYKEAIRFTQCADTGIGLRISPMIKEALRIASGKEESK